MRNRLTYLLVSTAFLLLFSHGVAKADCYTQCDADYASCNHNCPQCPCYEIYEACFDGCQYADTDFDGVTDPNDNCPETSNSNQANCDGDGVGDVCDSSNANYQAITAEETCMTDKDQHSLGYFTFEHHVEWLERDMSSCGATDRWRSRIREDNSCVAISDYDCCIGLDDSIEEVGDSPAFWCHQDNRNENNCH
ncbi:MAG TPA: hypothetical protein VF179_27145 [Thermoanaerobaculia bacterium]|nr:hypothetical protein [Thermoanaerobaculia bacterium]